MPIDLKKYHPKWSLISRLIRLRRAGNRCEHCGVRNYSVGHWENGTWHPLCGNLEADNYGHGMYSYKKARQYANEYNEHVAAFDTSIISLKVIILTVAHLDHDVKNNRFSNLAALCQRCHLNYDRRDNWRRRKYGPKGQYYGQLTITI